MCVGEWTEGCDGAVTGLLPALFRLLTLCKKNFGRREAGIGLILLDRGVKLSSKRYLVGETRIEAREERDWGDARD